MRRILVTLDGAGETTCDGCTLRVLGCGAFNKRLYDDRRLPECLAAEAAAHALRDTRAICTHDDPSWCGPECRGYADGGAK